MDIQVDSEVEFFAYDDAGRNLTVGIVKKIDKQKQAADILDKNNVLYIAIPLSSCTLVQFKKFKFNIEFVSRCPMTEDNLCELNKAIERKILLTITNLGYDVFINMSHYEPTNLEPHQVEQFMIAAGYEQNWVKDVLKSKPQESKAQEDIDRYEDEGGLYAG